MQFLMLVSATLLSATLLSTASSTPLHPTHLIRCHIGTVGEHQLSEAQYTYCTIEYDMEDGRVVMRGNSGPLPDSSLMTPGFPTITHSCDHQLNTKHHVSTLCWCSKTSCNHPRIRDVNYQPFDFESIFDSFMLKSD